MHLSELNPNTIQYSQDSDSKKAFNENWANKKSKEQLIQNKYDSATVIKYQIDHYGLRNPPGVDISNSILTLGCSITYGIGLDINDTWTSQLGDILNESMYNAGIPAASNDTAFRLVNYLVPKYKPKAVILLTTFTHRYEFYYKDKFYNYIATGDGPIWIHGDFELAGDLHNEFNTNKNILAMSYICDKFDIPFIQNSHLVEGYLNHNVYKPDYARDLIHPGKIINKEITIDMKNLLLDF